MADAIAMTRLSLMVGPMLLATAIVAFGCRAGSQDEDDPKDAISAALMKPATLKFDEVKLTDVVEYIEGRYSIQIVVDSSVMPESSHHMPTVTCDITGVPLGDALRQMLHPLELDYCILEGGYVGIVGKDHGE